MLSINGREISLRAYCSQFNFRSGDQQACARHSTSYRNKMLILCIWPANSDCQQWSMCAAVLRAEEGGRTLRWRT